MGMMDAEMDEEEEEEEKKEEADCVYHMRSNEKVVPVTEANRLQVLPTWADNYRESFLGLMFLTRCHFFAVMAMERR